jgi:Flp pilus assembly protein TadG
MFGMHLMRHKWFRRLRRDQRAVAAVEFALILPLLLTLYLGTVEAAALYTVDQRVSTVANTMADLVSRERDTIAANTTLNNYFHAAQGIMLPYSTDGLKQVVSMLQISPAGAATVRWSVGYNGGVARTVNSAFDMTDDAQINLLARNSSGFLVVSEIVYPYRPMLGLVINRTFDIGHTAYFLPRYEAYIGLS